MQNRLVHIVLYFIACCFSFVAIANHSYQHYSISPEALNSDISYVVREQVSRSEFVRITFLDDSCDITCIVNKGIKYFELSEYVKSQTQKLNQMSLEILKVFSEEELADFNNRRASPIVCELTVLKDGKIVNTTLIIPEKFSAEVSDHKLRDIKEVITHTQLDGISHNALAVRFSWGIPRELIVKLLKSKN